jgi:hypothetical protein
MTRHVCFVRGCLRLQSKRLRTQLVLSTISRHRKSRGITLISLMCPQESAMSRLRNGRGGRPRRSGVGDP